MLTVIKHHIVAKSCQMVQFLLYRNHFYVHVRVKMFFLVLKSKNPFEHQPAVY